MNLLPTPVIIHNGKAGIRYTVLKLEKKSINQVSNHTITEYIFSLF